MSYDNLERKQRFPEKSCNKHIVISYIIHTISIIFIIILMTKTETQLTPGRQLTGAAVTPVTDWYTFDKTTKTLQFNAQTVIIGDRKLRKSLGGSNDITKLILHGYLQTTGIDIEKEVIVHGTNNIIRGPPGVAGINGLAGAPGLDGIAGQDGATGVDGINGLDGTPGVDGVPGVAGIDGLAGAPGLDGASGESEWWEYNATEDVLFIKSKMVTVDILDVVDTAYVHNMLYAGNLDTAVIGGHPGHPSVDGI